MFYWLLLIFFFITCHLRILQCVELKNFCSFAVCCSFSITREYRLNEAYCVCFQLFVYGFIIIAEKVSLSKIWKSSPLFLRQTSRLFEPVFVCITVSSVKGYLLLSYVCPQRKCYTPYVKISFQISWGINVKATHNCSSGPLQKKDKIK